MKYIQKSIRFPKELKELLEKIARKERRDFGNLVVKIVEDYLHIVDSDNRFFSKEITELIDKWKD